MDERVARHLIVTGRVQGVAFRWSAQTRALELGVDGWIRNLADGRVETWVEGPPAAVEAMTAWLRRGPSLARVDGITLQEGAPQDLSGYEVRSSARA